MASWTRTAAAAAASVRFGPETVRALAQRLSAAPYRPPVRRPSPAHSYDAYRSVRFRPERARWRGEGLPFQLQFFPMGYLFTEPVELFEVEGGQARPIRFAREDFTAAPGLPEGYAGFRIHAALNRPDYLDELCVFLGASYFRSLGAGQSYGLSARGLAIGTDAAAEEFPAFRRFWIERPAAGARTVTVHALLDSPSVAGAYRFVITPGTAVRFDVEATLFPRRDIDKVGFAPQSSMYLFGPPERIAFDDFRDAVHDSEGLQILTAGGERLWRPLRNPAHVAWSVFEGPAPQGFGLVQRSRDFAHYQDGEARYERRPDLWVEPGEGWGAGAVMLMEIPSRTEHTDNIAAFWRPAQPLRAGVATSLSYRLWWGERPPADPALARVVRTGVSADEESGGRVFAVDFEPAEGIAPDRLAVESSSTAGTLSRPSLSALDGRRLRAAFRFRPPPQGVAELRLRLMQDRAPRSETWLYQWSA